MLIHQLSRNDSPLIANYYKSRNFADFNSKFILYCMYKFEYFKCKFVRIIYKISGLAEVESASFFLVR